MPDLRIHEYATRQELFAALPKGAGLHSYQMPVAFATALFRQELGEPKQVWHCGDLVFVAGQDMAGIGLAGRDRAVQGEDDFLTPHEREKG